MALRQIISAGGARPWPAELPIEDQPLTAKEALFVESYLDCLNGSEAARRAKYARKSAAVTASRLLRKANVRKSLAAGFKDRVMGRDEILTRLSELAAFDSGELLKDVRGGVTMDLKTARRHGLTRFIKKYTRTQTGETVELYSALEAIQLLGKYYAMFVDRSEITGKNGGPIELDDVQARLLSRFAQGDAADKARSVPESTEPG